MTTALYPSLILLSFPSSAHAQTIPQTQNTSNPPSLCSVFKDPFLIQYFSIIQALEILLGMADKRKQIDRGCSPQHNKIPKRYSLGTQHTLYIIIHHS